MYRKRGLLVILFALLALSSTVLAATFEWRLGFQLGAPPGTINTYNIGYYYCDWPQYNPGGQKYNTVFKSNGPVMITDAGTAAFHFGRHHNWVSTEIRLLRNGVVVSQGWAGGNIEDVVIYANAAPALADEIQVCGANGPSGPGSWWAFEPLRTEYANVQLKENQKLLGNVQDALNAGPLTVSWKLLKGIFSMSALGSAGGTGYPPPPALIKITHALGGVKRVSQATFTKSTSYNYQYPNYFGPMKLTLKNGANTVYQSTCGTTLAYTLPKIAADTAIWEECSQPTNELYKNKAHSGTFKVDYYDTAASSPATPVVTVEKSEKSKNLGTIGTLVPGITGTPPTFIIDHSSDGSYTYLWFGDASQGDTATPQSGTQSTNALSKVLYACVDRNHDNQCDWQSPSYNVNLRDNSLLAMSWLGGSTDYTKQASTSVSSDGIYGCQDLNQNGQCDTVEAQPCTSLGGDWIPAGPTGTCCGANPSGMDVATCGTQLAGVGICGRTASGAWKWASRFNPGEIAMLRNVSTGCPNITVVSDGTDFYYCGSSQPIYNVLPATYLGTIRNISLGSVGHEYTCNNTFSQLYECGGNTGGFSSVNAHNMTSRITNAGQTLYCAFDGDYTPDLDSKNDASCEAQGFEWTGTKCCSEADDPGETYDDANGNGACWKKAYVQNYVGFVENNAVMAVNGTLQGCGYTGAAVPLCISPPSGMLRWYAGDGNGDDQTKNGGALTGNASYGSGHVGGALSFDGKTIVSVPYASDLDFGAVQDFTIDAWIKPAPVDVNWADPLILNSLNIAWTIFHKRSIYALGNPSGPPYINYGDGYYLYYTPRGDLFFIIKRGANTYAASLQDYTTYGHTFWENQWHHIAAVREGNTMKIYLDGATRSANSVYTNSEVSGTVLALYPSIGGDPGYGGSNPAPPSHFNGSIDEVEIFNRALSDAEIKAIYDSGAEGKCKNECIPPPSGLVSWWSGDDVTTDLKSGFNGVLQANAGYTQGQAGKAFNFVGGDSRMTVASNPALDAVFAQDFTIDLWARTPSPPAIGVTRIIASKFSAAANTGWQIRLVSPAGSSPDQIQFLVSSSGQGGFVQTSFPIGPWQRLTAVKQGASIKFYVNGVAQNVNQQITSALSFANTADLLIGSNTFIGGTGMVGNVDEIKLFNRALSDSEIQSLATSTYCSASSSSPSGLPHPNPVCTMVQGASQIYCSNAGQWKVDTTNSNRTILKGTNWSVTSPDIATDCCSATSCWTGNKCQVNQLGDGTPINYVGHRCEAGNWVKRTLRYNWNRQSKAYCTSENQCLVLPAPAGSLANDNNPSTYFNTNQLPPQCIADGQYLLDHSCEAGIWSTRTKNVALRLLGYANASSPTSYTLFCGPSSEALNLPSSVQNYVNPNSCSIGNTPVPCVNNFCVLTTPNGIAWGVALNNQVNDVSKSFLANPLGINKSKDFCDNAAGSPGYAECGGSGSNVWYDPTTASIIVLPSGAGISGNSQAALFAAYIQSPLDSLKQFVFTSLQGPLNDYTFFNNTHTFNKLYAARSGTRQMFAFLEEDVFENSIRRDYIGVRFTNVDLGPNPCFNLILQYDPQASCNATATGVNIVRQRQGSPSTPSPLLQAWRDITAKLRPG